MSGGGSIGNFSGALTQGLRTSQQELSQIEEQRQRYLQRLDELRALACIQKPKPDLYDPGTRDMDVQQSEEDAEDWSL